MRSVSGHKTMTRVDPKCFSAALREYRLAAGFGQRELGEALRVLLPKAGSATVSRWEREGPPGDKAVIELLEELLQVPDHDLLRKAGRYIDSGTGIAERIDNLERRITTLERLAKIREGEQQTWAGRGEGQDVVPLRPRRRARKVGD